MSGPPAETARSSPYSRSVATDFGRETVIGTSKALRDTVALARKVAASRRTVLLVGATGTGKELFARGIHYASPAEAEPFVAVNCAAIPDTLLESELFGHERGAFTGAGAAKQGLIELAGSGTLFLDEVGELPIHLQPKLLRVLEEHRVRRVGGVHEIEIRCRIIVATNVALEDAVARGEFREDLFYRLNVFRLNLPRLRDREEDIGVLALHFLEKLAAELGTEPKTLSPGAVAALRMHDWPGNVRELKNVVERGATLCDGSVIRADHLMIQRRTSLSAASTGAVAAGEIRIPPHGKSLEAIEREAVALMLQLTHGNQSAAARILGISRPTLARKMQRYGLVVQEPGR